MAPSSSPCPPGNGRFGSLEGSLLVEVPPCCNPLALFPVCRVEIGASKHPHWSSPGLPDLIAVDIGDQVTLCCAGCLGHRRVFNHNPGLSPSDAEAGGFLQCDNPTRLQTWAKYPPGGKNLLQLGATGLGDGFLSSVPVPEGASLLPCQPCRLPHWSQLEDAP